MVSSILSLIGWTIVPDFITNQLLRLFYSLLHSKLQIQPPPTGSPSYRRHYAYTFSLVVLSYLSYNLIQSARSMPPNFYQLLGVSPTVDDAGLKVAFRQFAKLHHPDRLRGRPQVGNGDQLFMFVRDAYEALKNPTTRFAYDRFGPAVLTWTDCLTPGEYIRRGLFRAVGYHVVVGVALLFWSMIGSPSPVSFWRYLLYASLFMAELVLILTPSHYSLSTASLTSLPGVASAAFSSFIPNLPNLQPTISPFTIFHTLLPSQVAYQHVQLLHQLFIFLSVALSRVAPLLFPQNDPKLEVVLLDRINALLAHADREVSIGLHTQLQSVSPHEDDDEPGQVKDKSRVSFSKMKPIEALPSSVVNSLVAEMVDVFIDGNIRKDGIGPLRAASDAALERARRSNVDSGFANVKDEDEEDDDDDDEDGDNELAGGLRHLKDSVQLQHLRSRAKGSCVKDES